MKTVNTAGFQHFHKSDWNYFKEDFADFDKHWTEVTKRLGNDFINYLRAYIQKNLFTLSENCKLKVELIIDSNIIFREVLSLMRGKPSFLIGIIDNPFLALYAPPKIIDEVNRTIDEDLPKKLSVGKAKRIAKEILSKVTILKGQLLTSWKKAYEKAHSLIGNLDKDDVPFLALAFSVKSHGVITRNTKHFAKQDEVEIWSLSKTGNVISDLTKGSFSFFFFGMGIHSVLQFCYYICVSFLRVISEVISLIIYAVAALTKGSIEVLSKIPPQILFWVLVVTGAIFLFSNNAREKAGDILEKLGEKVMELIMKIKETFSSITEGIKQIIEILMPFISLVLKGVGYLFYQSSQLVDRINELEESRVEDESNFS